MKKKSLLLSFLGCSLIFAGCSSSKTVEEEPIEEVKSSGEEESETNTYTCYKEHGEDSNPAVRMTCLAFNNGNSLIAMLDTRLDISANNGLDLGEGWKQQESKEDGYLRFWNTMSGKADEKEIMDKMNTAGYACFAGEEKSDDERSKIQYWENRLKERYESSQASSSNTAADGIRPEFQEAMDQFVAFFQSYADFMQRYSETDDVVSLLNEYSEMMTRYSEMMDAYDAWDESEMSTEELKLYIDTNAEIQKILASVY